MALEILKCPNCGAGVPASFAGAISACDFCGAVLSGLALRPPAAAPQAPPATDAARAVTPPVVQRVRRRSGRAGATFTEAELLALARRRLGVVGSLYFDGGIPAGKLAAALKTHGRSIGRVLVQYDDTFFGGADDGFVLTAAALHWKNLTEDPVALRWADIDPAAVEIDDDGVRLGDRKIDVVLEESRPMIHGLVRLICDLAAWARGHGPPND